MPLYFAYGSNMSREAMAQRCPRARAVGVARLMRHRLAVMREGWLTATRDPRGAVHGILWDLPLAEIVALDRYEEVATGLYVKLSQPVVAAGGAKRALIYFGANSGPGVARADTIAATIAAARAWGLPREALSSLEALAPGLAASPAGAAPAASQKLRPLFSTPFDRTLGEPPAMGPSLRGAKRRGNPDFE